MLIDIDSSHCASMVGVNTKMENTRTLTVNIHKGETNMKITVRDIIGNIEVQGGYKIQFFDEDGKFGKPSAAYDITDKDGSKDLEVTHMWSSDDVIFFEVRMDDDYQIVPDGCRKYLRGNFCTISDLHEGDVFHLVNMKTGEIREHQYVLIKKEKAKAKSRCARCDNPRYGGFFYGHRPVFIVNN